MNKVKKSLKYLSWVIILALIVGVGAYFWLRPTKALNFVLPNLNQLSYVYAKVHSDTAYVNAIGVLENKAPYKITIDSLTYRLDLAGVELVSETLAVCLEQVPGQTDTITLFFRIPIQKARGVIKDIQSKDSTYITGDFQITYNTIFGKTTVGIKRDIDIKVPRPPDFKLTKVRANGVNLKEKKVNIVLDLEVINNSDEIGVKLRDLEYNAKIGDNIVGYGSYDKMLVVDPLAHVDVSLPINIKFDKPFEVLWNVVSNQDSMDYEINLEGVLDNDSIQDVPVSIQATGRAELVK